MILRRNMRITTRFSRTKKSMFKEKNNCNNLALSTFKNLYTFELSNYIK